MLLISISLQIKIHKLKNIKYLRKNLTTKIDAIY